MGNLGRILLHEVSATGTGPLFKQKCMVYNLMKNKEREKVMCVSERESVAHVL